jgi:hypothetical protein
MADLQAVLNEDFLIYTFRRPFYGIRRPPDTIRRAFYTVRQASDRLR